MEAIINGNIHNWTISTILCVDRNGCWCLLCVMPRLLEGTRKTSRYDILSATSIMRGVSNMAAGGVSSTLRASTNT